MERGGVGESRGEVIARRLKTVPAVVLGLVIVTALAPALLAVSVIVDTVRFAGSRKPFMATRLLAFLWIYLAGETVGLLALGGLWVGAGFGRRREWMVEWTWRFQQVWAGWMFWGASRVMGLRVEVEGQEALAPGPVIVLVRHASIVDNLLPSVFVARAHRIHLRYVMKRELLSDPCLDVAGKRLPNYFVRRDTGEAVEVENVRRLAEGLGPEDGLLLYPEGTRFTEERRLRAIEKVRERDPERADRVEQLVHLLPPKVGGFLAVLDGAPGVDVVVMAHAGFDGLRLISDMWQGALVGRIITVGFTRTARSAIADDTAGRVLWLDAAWLKADVWIGNQLHKP
jgi:1-acyl-sn-glycerol-3-phosphate acyltransferase